MITNNKNSQFEDSVTFELWDGLAANINLSEIACSSISVKGVSYHNPLRLMEIYGNMTPSKNNPTNLKRILPKQSIGELFFPNIPGVKFTLGDEIYQPPFKWSDCDERTLCLNFTYSTNAIYRILEKLSFQGSIDRKDIDSILDDACILLSEVYKYQKNYIMRNMNNSFNMYLISKVIEILLGKHIYDSELQELELTQKSLEFSLEMTKEYSQVDVIDKMGISIGKGVAFVENHVDKNGIKSPSINQIIDISFQYFKKRVKIDHRYVLLDMITNYGMRNDSFILAVILDDASETVDDLIWMLDLIKQFSFFKINLIINTAQISINFSEHMLSNILYSESFNSLSSRLGSQLFITKIYCPFISFQTNYLPPEAKTVIAESDAVFIKGANFFETCQIFEKPSFHAFVVYGPISRLYTGLNDYDGVFAYVPEGTTGYKHSNDPSEIIKLCDISGSLFGRSN